MRLLTLTVAAVAAALPYSPVSAQSPIKHVQVQVAATNDEWTSTTLSAGVGDIILVLSQGRIRIGQWLGEVDATGTSNGDGALTLKVGVSAPVRVGQRSFQVAEQAGEVKLRVADRVYTDNTGAFTVNVLVIPASSIQAPTVIAP